MHDAPISSPFPAVNAVGKYARELVVLRDTNASGIYAILNTSTGAALYIGESHTGRLYDTITRHFRRWKLDPSQDTYGRRRGGTTYERRDVSVMIYLCDPTIATDEQYKLIRALKPRDNSLDCHTCDGSDVPF